MIATNYGHGIALAEAAEIYGNVCVMSILRRRRRRKSARGKITVSLAAQNLKHGCRNDIDSNLASR